MILVIDNYDSFTYNLVQNLGELGAEPLVYRNDQITVEQIARLAPSGIVISPGPGVPGEAGISVAVVKEFCGRIPILGVCLGHQAIGEALGGRIIRAERIMHGKPSVIEHTGEGVLDGVPARFTAMRYHSLVIDPESVPADLKVTAWTRDRPRGREIMAVEHRTAPVFGVQFHPESAGTEVGAQILASFVTLTRSTAIP